MAAIRPNTSQEILDSLKLVFDDKWNSNCWYGIALN